MARGQLQGRVLGEHAQQGNVDAGQGFGEQGLVPATAHPIQHHPGQLHLGWAVVTETPHQGRQRTGLPGGFHHQHYW